MTNREKAFGYLDWLGRQPDGWRIAYPLREYLSSRCKAHSEGKISDEELERDCLVILRVELINMPPRI